MTDKTKDKIYVGNLPYSVTKDDLNELFGAHGEVKEVKIVMDNETGRSKGFAFVTFEDAGVVAKVIEETNGKEYSGRTLRVNIADDKPKSSSKPSSGGFNKSRY